MSSGDKVFFKSTNLVTPFNGNYRSPVDWCAPSLLPEENVFWITETKLVGIVYLLRNSTVKYQEMESRWLKSNSQYREFRSNGLLG